MKEEEFFDYINNELKTLNMEIDEKESNKFFKYMELLLKWNNNMNLTAITIPNEIILKHFVDSLSINQFIDKEAKIVDVGTGAGFPGIPIAIHRENVNITLIDSLNKRINFLNEVIKEIQLDNTNAIHGRAEDCGKNIKLREKFDIATSRAVAPLNVLAEYLLPFVKIGGICICMKGPNIKEELEQAKKTIDIMGGKIEKIERIEIGNMVRNILIIRKEKVTPQIYPRKAGIPSKVPIS